MNLKRFALAVFAFVVVLFVLTPRATRAADDGAALYKSKCAPCQGADGAGKPAVKAPSLISDKAKKLSDEELTDMISNGGKDKKASHAFSKKGLSDDQVKALVAYIRTMQKK